MSNRHVIVRWGSASPKMAATFSADLPEPTRSWCFTLWKVSWTYRITDGARRGKVVAASFRGGNRSLMHISWSLWAVLARDAGVDAVASKPCSPRSTRRVLYEKFLQAWARSTEARLKLNCFSCWSRLVQEASKFEGARQLVLKYCAQCGAESLIRVGLIAWKNLVDGADTASFEKMLLDSAERHRRLALAFVPVLGRVQREATRQRQWREQEKDQLSPEHRSALCEALDRGRSASDMVQRLQGIASMVAQDCREASEARVAALVAGEAALRATGLSPESPAWDEANRARAEVQQLGFTARQLAEQVLPGFRQLEALHTEFISAVEAVAESDVRAPPPNVSCGFARAAVAKALDNEPHNSRRPAFSRLSLENIDDDSPAARSPRGHPTAAVTALALALGSTPPAIATPPQMSRCNSHQGYGHSQQQPGGGIFQRQGSHSSSGHWGGCGTVAVHSGISSNRRPLPAARAQLPGPPSPTQAAQPMLQLPARRPIVRTEIGGAQLVAPEPSAASALGSIVSDIRRHVQERRSTLNAAARPATVPALLPPSSMTSVAGSVGYVPSSPVSLAPLSGTTSIAVTPVPAGPTIAAAQAAAALVGPPAMPGVPFHSSLSPPAFAFQAVASTPAPSPHMG
eukprot:TRINITY_DN20352_c0_g1_i3.p1 TRINITY_DN20352_c0_g1~~TRINITY_DN20352_c0_g1_i3.p1  ORF type:complete len:631 (+),score=112.87 TRINITY_DN20352_c0_g1_i3:77-1969(+)